MTKKAESRIPLDDLLVFHQVARSLTSSFDLDTILRTIVGHMERFIEADLWTLLMLDEARQELYYAIAAGGKEDSLRNLRVKVGEGVAGWVVEHGETLLVPEAQNDPRVKQEPGAKPNSVRSVIAIPLRGRNPRPDQLTDYSIAFLHILADHAAIAIENAHDVARIHQLTITDDTTGLYNVRYLYEVLGRELERCGGLKLPVSLAFLDLDHFKLVNDKHGHLIGSELLSRAGQRLQPQTGLVLPLWRRRVRHPDAGNRRGSRAGASHRAEPRADEDQIPNEERTGAARGRQRGRGNRSRRRRRRSRHHRRRRYAHVLGKSQWARRGQGSVGITLFQRSRSL
jgi:GAF domain-containing protein